ncbi:MAG: type I restriction enzyme HsdR N-terminal domain-containing protein [Bacteroidales bacterium]|nr:type I restriction enzyme HsdR N-terminal domain-containing protein [Bacteroidales bacterium]
MIFDSIRKKYVALTPEEWVRQHLIHYLTTEKQYPPSLISIETPLKYALTDKRSDLIIYNRNGQALLLAECKAPNVLITRKTFEQIAIYHQRVCAHTLLLTNGLTHYCVTVRPGQPARFLTEIPDFSALQSGR